MGSIEKSNHACDERPERCFDSDDISTLQASGTPFQRAERQGLFASPLRR
jgi:hypothetical protein